MWYLKSSPVTVGFAAGCLALTTAVAGCGGGTGSAGGGSRSATSLYLTDAPLSGADAVTLTIDKIEVRGADGGFVDTGIAPIVGVNLLTLKNTESLLGSVTLPAGDYNGLRLSISNGTITIGGIVHPLIPVTGRGGAHGPNAHAADTATGKDGRSATLLIPGSFSVASDGTSPGVLLDFNVARSVVATGNGDYLLKPVIVSTHKEDASEVAGKVSFSPPPSDGTEPEVSVSVTPSSVAANSDETNEANGTSADPAARGGGFMVHALPSGTYNVTATAQGYAPVTIPNVTITPGQRPNLGTITLHKK